MTIGDGKMRPSEEVTTNDALQVASTAQLAGVGHVAMVCIRDIAVHLQLPGRDHVLLLQPLLLVSAVDTRRVPPKGGGDHRGFFIAAIGIFIFDIMVPSVELWAQL